MKKVINLLVVICISVPLFSQNIDQALFDLEGVRFEKTEGTSTNYTLYIKQPLDHWNADAGYFYQKVLFTHQGFDRPTVMNTQGYFVRPRANEVQQILDANYLNIEHRYFGESIPDSLDWRYLNLKQATADLHRINQLFKTIYPGQWISTGISKGGQTTIFYRYFYPDDVDVSIPYVAPLNESIEDKRIYKFLDTVGTKECRAQIADVQLFLLKNKEDAIDRLKWFAKGQGLTFDYLDNSLEKAFEYAVLEYPFSFWQWGHSCEDLPHGNELDDYLESFISIIGLEFYGDQSMKLFAPHYHQASLEMGYYGFETKRFKKYLDVLDGNPNASFPPKSVSYNYDNSLNKKVMKWLDKEGNRFIYINGDWDTWSATKVQVSKKVDALSIDLAKTDHGKARIKNMNQEQRQRFANAIEKWTQLAVDFTPLDR